MSRENVDVVRQVVDAFNRQDRLGIALAPQRRVARPAGSPRERRTCRVGSIRCYFEELLEIAADGWNVEVDAIESVGPNRVLIRARSVVVGRESGMSTEDGLFQVVDLEAGQLRRVRNFRTEAEALETVGLRE